MRPLLLDTHAAIWLAAGDQVSPEVREAVDASGAQQVPIMVSAISAWEVAMLAAKGRLLLGMEPLAWFRGLLDIPWFELAALSPDVLVASGSLPGTLHRDPVDRMLVATARAHGYRLVTRDRKLLDYGAAGHVQTLAC